MYNTTKTRNDVSLFLLYLNSGFVHTLAGFAFNTLYMLMNDSKKVQWHCDEYPKWMIINNEQVIVRSTKGSLWCNAALWRMRLDKLPIDMHLIAGVRWHCSWSMSVHQQDKPTAICIHIEFIWFCCECYRTNNTKHRLAAANWNSAPANIQSKFNVNGILNAAVKRLKSFLNLRHSLSKVYKQPALKGHKAPNTMSLLFIGGHKRNKMHNKHKYTVN